MTLPDNQVQNPELGVQVPGATVRQLTHGRDLSGVPMWQIRLRLMRRSFGTTWGLFRENRMGMVGLALILLFALMAVIHPILMATVWDPAVYDPVVGYNAVTTEYTVVEDGTVTDPATQIEQTQARLELNPTIDAGDVVSIPTQPAPPSMAASIRTISGPTRMGATSCRSCCTAPAPRSSSARSLR